MLAKPSELVPSFNEAPAFLRGKPDVPKGRALGRLVLQ